CILYEMLTSTVPFDDPHSTMRVLMKHILSQPPPPRALRPEVPPRLEAIVLRALSKDPAARFPSVRDLERALLDVLESLGEKPPERRSAGIVIGGRSAPLWAAAPILGLMLVGGALISSLRPAPDRDRGEAPALALAEIYRVRQEALD